MQHFFYALLDILNQMSPYILLGFLLAGLLHVFVRPETMSRHLAGRGWKPVVKAALIGIPLPLCSCGVLPTAISLRRQGASKGATTSFLIATPQTGVDSIAATYALLGLPMAIIRPIAALVGSFAGGMAVDIAGGNDGSSTAPAVAPAAHETCCDEPHRSFFSRLLEAVRYGLVDMVASVGKWLVVGLVVAAVITVAVPDELFLSLASRPILAMLVMVAVAVPMYICATGSIPIAMSLMLKGLTPGVAFVLLMAGPAANFASVLLLRRDLGRRSTAIYVGSVVVTAILFGIIIDYLLPASWFALPAAVKAGAAAAEGCHHAAHSIPVFATLCSALLVGLLIYGYIHTRFSSPRTGSCCSSACSCASGNGHASAAVKNNNNTETKNNDMNTTENIASYKVEGMACAHCKATVEKAVAAIPGAVSASVDLSLGTVTVEGPVAPESVEAAVHAAGFNFAGKA